MPIDGDVEDLLKTVKTGKNWSDRSRAAEALGKLKESSAVKALITALDDPEETGSCSSHGRHHTGYFRIYPVKNAASFKR
jgi:HEAT repeat protein